MTEDVRAQAFRALYGHSVARVTGFVLRRLSSPEDAADVVAETFMVAWRKWDQIPAGDAALYWLYATARYAIANHRRREDNRSAVVWRIGNELGRLLPDSAPAVDQDRIDAKLALELLPAALLEVVLLAAWEGLSPAEIAAVLGCSTTAAKVRLHRARRLLEQVLASEPPTSRTNIPPRRIAHESEL